MAGCLLDVSMFVLGGPGFGAEQATGVDAFEVAVREPVAALVVLVLLVIDA
jgi:hypothetical protein